MHVKAKSCWQAPAIRDFLSSAEIPLRLACMDKDGLPLICSLWFYFDQDCLWAATHKQSYIIGRLKDNPAVGFEIATNDYPYKGVRGKANVELLMENADTVLGQLMKKYLGSSNQALQDWLMSRSDDEYVLRIPITEITAWDFSHRMSQ